MTNFIDDVIDGKTKLDEIDDYHVTAENRSQL